MDNRFNTIAGWVLGAGIVLLGAILVTGELFRAERPETMGYPIAGVEQEEDAAAEQPIAFYLQTADAGRGEAQFRKCTSCHTINQGGAAGLGPNLHGIMGAGIAQRAGFNFSEALRAHGGTWGWDTMSAWIDSPRTFAPGTRMTFPGLADPQARADLLLYLNSQGGNLQVPPPPAAAASAGNEAAEANGAAEANAAGTNSAEPQGRSEGDTKGPAATDTSGRAAQERDH